MRRPPAVGVRSGDELAAALALAHRWCVERDAEIRWDEGEGVCRVRVRAPRGRAALEGAGAGLYEAYVECRVRYDAALCADPPSWL